MWYTLNAIIEDWKRCATHCSVSLAPQLHNAGAARPPSPSLSQLQNVLEWFIGGYGGLPRIYYFLSL